MIELEGIWRSYSMGEEVLHALADIDLRIDLYAVGAMMYVMLSGQNPFQASNYNALLAKILTEEPPALKTIRTDLDTHLMNVVDKAMARERDQRFTSAREFIEALHGSPVVAPSTLESSTDEDRGNRSSKNWLGIPIALAIAMVGGLVAAQALGLFTDGSTAGEDRRVVADVVGAANVDAGESTGDAATARTGRSDASSKMVGERVEPATPAHINVAIKTVPLDARIYINGRLVSNPASERLLRAEGETLVVRVEKEGYQDHEEIFPRSEDVTTEIALSKSPPRVKQGKGPRTKGTGFRWGVD